ncbi:MAG: protein-methionine-sulfoxide reductase catalytic subunit MsrP [Pseudomonadota bacterium]
MHYRRKKGWELPENAVTDEARFRNRRAVLAGLGAVGAIAAGGVVASRLGPMSGRAVADTPGTAAEIAKPPNPLYPAKQNTAYVAGRPITPEEINARYNNFYEFGSSKQIAAAAQALQTDPWSIRIDGLVEQERTVDFADLEKRFPLEERIYRHRCVEAWSMVAPWTGFPLSALVDYARPLGTAKYVRFETFLDPKVASGQRASWYPWPYVEGLTMAEARNDLSFMVTGAYGTPLANQFGAPLRLHTPWKYGFKSIKSLTRISFTAERPKSFWEAVSPREYGFWANVNPEVPHRRWSQATERKLSDGSRIPTVKWNGYGEWVAAMYADMKDEKIFY